MASNTAATESSSASSAPQPISDYDSYKACEKAFHEAEEAYRYAQTVLSEKAVVLQKAKDAMDAAYAQWRGDTQQQQPGYHNGSTAFASTTSHHPDGYDQAPPPQGVASYNDSSNSTHHHNLKKRKHLDPEQFEASYGGGGGGGGGREHYPQGPETQPRRSSHHHAPPSSSSSSTTRRTSLPPARATTATEQPFLNDSDPGLFIPFVHVNITAQRIKEIIESRGWGTVDRVDLVPLAPRPGKPPIHRAYVHFKQWSSSPEAQRQRRAYLQLKPGDHIPLVYEEPWFWKTMPNQPPPPK